MTKEILLLELKELQGEGDPESQHSTADYALLAFINDKDISEEYKKIKRWYA